MAWKVMIMPYLVYFGMIYFESPLWFLEDWFKIFNFLETSTDLVLGVGVMWDHENQFLISIFQSFSEYTMNKVEIAEARR